MAKNFVTYKFLCQIGDLEYRRLPLSHPFFLKVTIWLSMGGWYLIIQQMNHKKACIPKK